MSLYITIDSEGKIESKVDGLNITREDGVVYFHRGLSHEKVSGVARAYRENRLNKYFNEVQVELDNFLLIIENQSKSELKIYDDFFGSNELYFCRDNGSVHISDTVKRLFEHSSIEPAFRADAIYEHIAFQYIAPPHTIYEHIYTLTMSSVHTFTGKEVSTEEYWEVDSLLKDKTDGFSELVVRSREALLESLKKNMPENTAVALSGGIDSGGLLGMANVVSENPVKSISIGGHGPTTTYLEFARESAAYNNSEMHEIYPGFHDIKKLTYLYKGQNQPTVSDTLLPYSLIHEKASEVGCRGVIYGFGAEMLLGNLKVAKYAYTLAKIERMPKVILWPFYKLVTLWPTVSATNREALMSFSWAERFMYTRAALYVWERDYFILPQTDFWRSIKNKIVNWMNPTDMNIVDRITKAYLFSWVNYLQFREFNILARQFNTVPVIPFDSPRVVKHFYRASNLIRRRNKWKKAVIREMFKPYVSDHQFISPNRSLIIPYNKVLKGKELKIIHYLKGSPILSGLIDFKKVEDSWREMSEPGLFLFRILGVAVWYDVNWEPERIKEFEKIFA